MNAKARLRWRPVGEGTIVGTGKVSAMSIEDIIKNEVRLFALETIVCQNLATVYQSMPREIFDAVKKQALEGAKTYAFPGFDAAYSDIVSSEFEAALGLLYSMIQDHLDTAAKRRG
jgi:hypothetical protein